MNKSLKATHESFHGYVEVPAFVVKDKKGYACTCYILRDGPKQFIAYEVHPVSSNKSASVVARTTRKQTHASLVEYLQEKGSFFRKERAALPVE
jgi:hypothetical protein